MLVGGRSPKKEKKIDLIWVLKKQVEMSQPAQVEILHLLFEADVLPRSRLALSMVIIISSIASTNDVIITIMITFVKL